MRVLRQVFCTTSELALSFSKQPIFSRPILEHDPFSNNLSSNKKHMNATKTLNEIQSVKNKTGIANNFVLVFHTEFGGGSSLFNTLHIQNATSP